MNTYEIAVNDLLTTAQGFTEAEALENYATDAGYTSYAALKEEHPDEPMIKQLEEIQAVPSDEEGNIIGPSEELLAVPLASYEIQAENVAYHNVEVFLVKDYEYNTGKRRYFLRRGLNDGPAAAKPAMEISEDQAMKIKNANSDNEALQIAVAI